MAIPSEAKSSSNCTKVLVDTFASVSAMSGARRWTPKVSGEQTPGNTMVQSNRQRQSVEIAAKMTADAQGCTSALSLGARGEIGARPVSTPQAA
jgi:hypothetical protein